MKRRWRYVLVFGALAVAAGGAGYWLIRPPPTLTLASWGGEYGRVQQLALLRLYTDDTGTLTRAAVYGGGTRELAQQAKTKSGEWDVVDLEQNDATAACHEGLLAPIDTEDLPSAKDGTPAKKDFVPGALTRCTVGALVYAHVIAYANRAFADAKPVESADFFDLKRFPGMRGLNASGPEDNLELALLADGVAPGDVYKMLDTEAGVDRAFAKLDTIKDSIVWYRRETQPPTLLTQRAVAMTTALNGPIYDAIVEERRDISIVWAGERYQFESFGIPISSRHRRRAWDFIRFATQAAPLAAEAVRLPYGPARRSAFALIGNNPDTGQKMAAHLPTAPQNFAGALAVNAEFWAEHKAALDARWVAWMGL